MSQLVCWCLQAVISTDIYQKEIETHGISAIGMSMETPAFLALSNCPAGLMATVKAKT